ncbi:MAG: A/G-specific adenine glycosylase [Clostridia bacterium]|nr:A/G-specific adenine glycosylase [Clostridia bacterium]
MTDTASITASLLAWYDQHARTLPWRGIHDPYRTWVSEIMLQQTRVDTVLSYYERFMARFPTLKSLAGAKEEDVLKLWQGLGYYSRARNLLEGARQVTREFGGALPADPEKLRKIRGIGPYTAGAIASIAFDLPVPAVDGNVIRVLSRLFGIRSDPTLPKIRAEIDRLAASLVPSGRPGDHNQALMDLGASVCVPGTPDCARCPLSAFCDAFRAGDAADLPALPKAKPPKVIHYAVLLIRSGDRVLARRRTETMLNGLWCFPMLQDVAESDAIQSAVLQKWKLALTAPRLLKDARHVFTHQVWQMTIWASEAAPRVPAPAGFRFVPLKELGALPWPVAMAPALSCLNP